MTQVEERDINHTSKFTEKYGWGDANNPFMDDINKFTTIDSTLKTGSVNTIGDYKQLTGKDIVLFNEQIGGTGTSIYDSAHGGVNMSVSANNDYVIRETKATHDYVAGNPQIFELTTDNLIPTPGVIKRMGYFCSNSVAPFDSNRDGFYIETDDDDVYFKVSKDGVEVFPLHNPHGMILWMVKEEVD